MLSIIDTLVIPAKTYKEISESLGFIYEKCKLQKKTWKNFDTLVGVVKEEHVQILTKNK